MGKRGKATFVIILILVVLIFTNKSHNKVTINKNILSKGRSIAIDGYNYGKKWQCVEFVKRYYYDYYNHKMPNTYGHAKDFFDKSLNNGELNVERGLYQFNQGIPSEGSIIIFRPTKYNRYGHIGITGKTIGSYVIVYQQNSLSYITLVHTENNNVIGWLRAPKN